MPNDRLETDWIAGWLGFFSLREQYQPDYQDQLEPIKPKDNFNRKMEDKINALQEFSITTKEQQDEIERFNLNIVAMRIELEALIMQLEPINKNPNEENIKKSRIGNNATIQNENIAQEMANLAQMLTSYPQLPANIKQIQSAKEIEQVTQARVEHHALIRQLTERCLVIHQEKLILLKEQIRNSENPKLSR